MYSSQDISCCRNCPLDQVSTSLGLIQDKYDRQKYRGNHSIVSLDLERQLYFDHLAGVGGKGAINLVMHLQRCDFKQAIEFLGGTRVFDIVPQKPRKSRKALNRQKCNVLDRTCWQTVFDYLHRKRGLSDRFLNYMYQHKYIAADWRSNAVFFRYSINPNTFTRLEPLGVSLRSTRGKLKLLTPGTKRDRCWFFFKSHRLVNRIYLTESAIDAMSLATIHHCAGKRDGLYISVDGCGSLPIDVIKTAIARSIIVYTAFDNDEAGRQMSLNVTAQFPIIKSIYPLVGKDWNECLLNNATKNQYFF